MFLLCLISLSALSYTSSRRLPFSISLVKYGLLLNGLIASMNATGIIAIRKSKPTATIAVSFIIFLPVLLFKNEISSFVFIGHHPF